MGRGTPDAIPRSSPGPRWSTVEPSTLQETSDPGRATDQSSSLFSGFAGFFTLLLLTVVLCVLWKWKKWKKRHTPYRRVVGLPSLNRPRPRQRAKNIYDHLPRRQESLGRPQIRSTRVVSTESLLSRNSNSPAFEHTASQADNALPVHRACTQAAVYSVDIYDNALGTHMCKDHTPSVPDVNGRSCPSSSSENSHDYINVPTAVEIAEALASRFTSNNLSVSLGAPEQTEQTFTEEREQENTQECSSVWTPGSESCDLLSDGDNSSETSNDYVNMEGLDGGAEQDEETWVELQCCSDYENISAAVSQRSQQQQAEEVTSSSTAHTESRTDDSEIRVQITVHSQRFLALGDQVTLLPAAQSEASPMKHGEEVSKESSHDYENVQVAKAGSLVCLSAPC